MKILFSTALIIAGVLAIQAALISDHVKALKFPSGHWLMEEKPVETSAALRDFLAIDANGDERGAPI